MRIVVNYSMTVYTEEKRSVITIVIEEGKGPDRNSHLLSEQSAHVATG